MHLLILLALIAASPAANAATLRCTTAENCINDHCNPVTDPDSAFLLINPNGLAPIMRSDDDTTMTKLTGDAPMKWQGTQSLANDQIRISITLTINPTDLTYALESFGEFGSGISTGKCKVR